MVYITNDGNVLQTEPWGLKRIFGIFSGVIYMVVMFFRTLVNPSMSGRANDNSRDFRPGSGPPRPPRRLGRPNTGPTVNIPFGGCRSCAG
ncbi:hypothetical protein KM043_010735 [Ampulex compressa]|nr:hypothetical protein KM043_010735 [Ampulex compressa]